MNSAADVEETFGWSRRALARDCRGWKRHRPSASGTTDARLATAMLDAAAAMLDGAAAIGEQVHSTAPGLLVDVVLAERESSVKEAQVALNEAQAALDEAELSRVALTVLRDVLAVTASASLPLS